MALFLQKEIDNLKRKVLIFSTMVEENVMRSLRSVEKRDAAMAREAIDADDRIDAYELEIEEDCLKLLALYQPVAGDLRFIISVLKMNSDLERIGDLAVNIAERADALAQHPPMELSQRLTVMADKALAMLRNCLGSLFDMDAKRALQVCASDDEVDTLYREMIVHVKDGIRKDPAQLDDLLQLLSISRHLERMADHATNIAEDVVYLVDAHIIRHRTEEFVGGQEKTSGAIL